MKIFCIGSFAVTSSNTELAAMRAAIFKLGADIAKSGHDLVVCSPFEDSIDLEILRGAASAGMRGRIDVHFPDAAQVEDQVDRLKQDLGCRINAFRHPGIVDDGKLNHYAWLLAQLTALDNAHVLIAAGGRPGGTAEMLLRLAEAREFPALPIPRFGGAAAGSFERQRFVLKDRLGDLGAWLREPASLVSLDEVLTALVGPLSLADTVAPASRRVFLSYPRERAAEADQVEALLLRRNFTVTRDIDSFPPDVAINTSISEAIAACDVFVALYCAQYACSPYCHDELEHALKRHAAHKLRLWILQLDDTTRMVVRAARELPVQPASSREQLEASVLRLLAGSRGPR
ncbi:MULTISPECIES: toll/interleukin-1 receptor domain-containing protein [unclassified Sphingomonas]|uniref:toll/interleukin-1 receptor domain-containing protein n=1 Tax=unclassified Sphingomonas TaxID=196159 RepID=UPI00285EF67C|nr:MULTISPECIES: toll/interleukin-1 receptor domain-containing protein [unclassified Sphingomonas]MDR6116006.1 hypothetical protein [Sphingomonas sp. SORGH_AS_0789]MDR6150321.1 hypothetical protein [Sphingomonas sp. SORGH_AS_0742]